MRVESSTHMVARATSGQQIAIRYDAATNAIIYVEDDWSANVRGGAAPRTAFREQLESNKVKRLRRRAA